MLHACCHNPTGVDLTPEQWERVIEVVNARGLVPFLDIAYQGFADGIDADAAAVRRFAAGVPGRRSSPARSPNRSRSTASASARSASSTGSADEAARVLSQLKRVVRTNYSNPPTHRRPDRRHRAHDAGAAHAVGQRARPDARAHQDRCAGSSWKRSARVRADFDFSFVIEQRGMFSYSGLTKEQVLRLRAEYSIYAIDSGRICVAALNSKNIDYVAEAIAKVLV